MDDDIFSIVRQKIKAAGTDDPYEVAKFHGIEFIWLKGTIAGYATHYMKLVPIIGFNEKLDRMWYRFGGWHELTHVFDDHVYEEGFSNEHCDGAFFAQEIDSRSLSSIIQKISSNISVFHSFSKHLVRTSSSVMDKAVRIFQLFHDSGYT